MNKNKNLKAVVAALVCLTILNSIAPAQEEKAVPIATTLYLLGGSKNGKWVTADKIAPTLEKRTKVLSLGLKGVEKGEAFLDNTGEEYGACPENKVFKLIPETASGFAVGANADWNLAPRTPKLVNVADKTYQTIASDFLRAKGIVKTKINLSQIIEIDLEGDGQTETLIVGNFYKKAMTESQGAGDYSFALLRRVVRGKARNVLIDGEFFTKSSRDYSPPNEREILAVADLNGDGRMEFVLDTAYYEGDSKEVFEMQNGVPVKVLGTECYV